MDSESNNFGNFSPQLQEKKLKDPKTCVEHNEEKDLWCHTCNYDICVQCIDKHNKETNCFTLTIKLTVKEVLTNESHTLEGVQKFRLVFLENLNSEDKQKLVDPDMYYDILACRELLSSMNEVYKINIDLAVKKQTTKVLYKHHLF
jgi:hypothetical protein